MKKVAKLLVIDPEEKYLLMYRSDHPTFANDPDLPGGTVEDGESAGQAMLREVEEEAGINLDASHVCEIYAGADYSAHGTHYSLFMAKVSCRPRIDISWEHSSYEWLDQESFLEKSKNAKDTYMHMVHDTLVNMRNRHKGAAATNAMIDEVEGD